MDDILFVEAMDSSSDDDVEDAFVMHVLNEGNLGNRGEIYGRFNLETLTDVEAKRLFRFEKHHVERLRRALNIPDEVTTENRESVSGLEGLCILLRRLAYPNRLVDLEPIFGLSATALSNIINYMVNIISENKCHLLENLANLGYLNIAKCNQYAEAIAAKGSPIPNCWGFIDGTTRPICRPGINQEHYYSGHKKTHCIKFQSVLCPDGIVASLKGAYEGRRHDAGIFRESGLYEELENNVVFPNNNQHFVLYGDQAYGLRELLMRPYTEQEIAMMVLRVSVEWGFNKILQEFAFLDFKKNQKLLLQEVGKFYNVAMLLTNCHTCLYGGETSSYFNVGPPQLEEYLGN